MLNLLNLRFSRTRTVVAGMLLFALLVAAPFAGAVGASSAASLSGDDAYDPAAGGLQALYFAEASASYSGDDAYDPAASDLHGLAASGVVTRYTDDTACDPAALAFAGDYSGDDAYDPAAGGLLPDGAPLALACAPDGSSGLN
jgi:hypothetical protein